jgi:hypothetical protein
VGCGIKEKMRKDHKKWKDNKKEKEKEKGETY